MRRHPPHHLSPARANTRQGRTQALLSRPSHHSNAPFKPEGQSILSKIVALTPSKGSLRKSFSASNALSFVRAHKPEGHRFKSCPHAPRQSSSHSLLLWLQGFADQAMRSVECQVVNARASDHPVSLSHALVQAACPVALLVGDLTLAERYVKAIIDLSARHAVELWNVGGRCFEGMLLIKRGNIGAGLELLRTAFARVPQNLLSLLYTAFLAEIADALGRDGKAAEGLSIIDEALARSERNEERWCVAELLRVKGELILREGAPQAATAAEEHFLRSLDWARRQGALSWELRTATSLARLQQDQGRAAEARSLLQSVYDRFSEGFETADLKTAKAHLDSMQ